MVEDPDPRTVGRELTVIIITVMVVSVSLTLAIVSLKMATGCEVRYAAQNYGPDKAAFLVPLACVVPLGLALAWKLRPVFWIWTLVALVLTPVLAFLIVLSAGYCPD
jgi:hypothetical protein